MNRSLKEEEGLPRMLSRYYGFLSRDFIKEHSKLTSVSAMPRKMCIAQISYPEHVGHGIVRLCLLECASVAHDSLLHLMI